MTHLIIAMDATPPARAAPACAPYGVTPLAWAWRYVKWCTQARSRVPSPSPPNTARQLLSLQTSRHGCEPSKG